MTRSTKAKSIIAGAVAAALLLSLVPLLLAAPYARPSTDDYSFGEGLRNDGLRGLLNTVTSYYRSWQGSFTGTLLMSLQPAAVFGAQAYGSTGFILIGLLLASLFALVFAALRQTASTGERIIIASAAAYAAIQWAPFVPHAFFWWNGAIYYTGSFCLSLFMFTAMIRLKSESRGFIPRAAAICVSGFLLGGVNYVTALLNLLVCITASALMLLPRFNVSRRRKAAQAVFSLAVLAGLLVSALAPGNAVREAQYSGAPVFETVRLSLEQAANDVASFSRPELYLLAAALIPLFFRAAGKMRFKFPLPAIVPVYSFLLFAAQNAPVIFATGSRAVGEGRVTNIIYYSFVLLLLANIFYLCGYVAGLLNRRNTLVRAPAALAAVMPAAFIILSVFSFGATASGISIADLRDGLPQKSAEAFDRQYEVLMDGSADIALIPYNEVKTSIFDLPRNSADPTAWFNVATAHYYGKKLVSAYPEGFDPASYAPPVIEPVLLTLLVGKGDSAQEIHVNSYQGRMPLIVVSNELKGTPYQFRADIQGVRILVERNRPESKPAPPAADGGELRAVYKYDVDANGVKLYLSGFEINGEPSFRVAQLAQILGTDVVIK
ncbi:MAG: DUF6056 family protein [Oscillospiraceae bacterium]|nr:DUF6056 family protein [Oscillospiraceae bacterium]